MLTYTCCQVDEQSSYGIVPLGIISCKWCTAEQKAAKQYGKISFLLFPKKDLPCDVEENKHQNIPPHIKLVTTLKFFFFFKTDSNLKYLLSLMHKSYWFYVLCCSLDSVSRPFAQFSFFLFLLPVQSSWRVRRKNSAPQIIQFVDN